MPAFAHAKPLPGPLPRAEIRDSDQGITDTGMVGVRRSGSALIDVQVRDKAGHRSERRLLLLMTRAKVTCRTASHYDDLFSSTSGLLAKAGLRSQDRA